MEEPVGERVEPVHVGHVEAGQVRGEALYVATRQRPGLIPPFPPHPPIRYAEAAFCGLGDRAATLQHETRERGKVVRTRQHAGGARDGDGGAGRGHQGARSGAV